ncbi:Putative transposase of IS4/5 family (DUF4096) [Streptomyces noursei ATCC 11455]|nr:Putative transposase of IS4/5 family (DUF4096) [Streptomyces noursei ATCC 11455]
MTRRRCYPSDTFDDEGALIEPLLPTPVGETRVGGRPEKHPRREIVDAIRYVVDTGCKWRALPKDFPPWDRRLDLPARPRPRIRNAPDRCEASYVPVTRDRRSPRG